MSEDDLVRTQIHNVKLWVDGEFKAYAKRHRIAPGVLFERMWLAFTASEQKKIPMDRPHAATDGQTAEQMTESVKQ